MRECQDLVAFLREEYGDDVRMVVTFDADGYDIVHGADWYEQFLERVDTRSPEKMHEDALSTTRRTAASGELYDNAVQAELRVTERGVGCTLVLAREEGVFVWFDYEADVAVPDVVDACRERVGPRQDD